VALGEASLSSWTIVTAGAEDEVRIGDRRWARGFIRLKSQSDGALTVSFNRNGAWSAGRTYPGALRFTAVEPRHLDVVNQVDVERYVACVVANEVWPSFETEAYRAQAVAARTFVLFQMIRRNHAGYDVVATQSSQVYRGLRTDQAGQRAADAARQTQGVVLTWRDGGRDRLFCTYYSAACGGMSQSAAIFGPDNDVPPLAGGVPCDYCKIAPKGTYRWGPVRLTKAEVSRRLVAAYPELRSLGRIQDVAVMERSETNRPTRLRLTGSSGETYEMLGERFRLALGGTEIRSTDCSIRVTGRHIIFEHGRGFGHGLGLCQWGAQGQALLGKRAGEILRYYYPGSRLTRVY
jgi:stage II sporulation protein D